MNGNTTSTVRSILLLATLAWLGFLAMPALSETPSDGSSVTAAGHPAEGKIDLSLGEPKLLMHNISYGPRETLSPLERQLAGSCDEFLLFSVCCLLITS